MPRTFVTSDTWFNRLLEDDPNVNIVDNNERIIENWNSIVKRDDIVYVLGGFGIGDLYQVLVRLNGKIHFLNNYFNKDEKLFIDEMQKCVNASSDPEFKTRIVFEPGQIKVLNKLDAVISYFPLQEWCGKETGTYSFHGFDERMEINEHNISCVSWKWDMKPVDIEDVKNNIVQFNRNLAGELF